LGWDMNPPSSDLEIQKKNTGGEPEGGQLNGLSVGPQGKEKKERKRATGVGEPAPPSRFRKNLGKGEKRVKPSTPVNSISFYEGSLMKNPEKKTEKWLSDRKRFIKN